MLWLSNIYVWNSIYSKTREKKIGLTQQQVADESNIKLRQYQRYESGERNLSSASFDIARRVLEVLELDMSSYARGDHSIYEGTADISRNYNEYIAQAQNGDVSSTSIFRDKICVFIGKLECCSRQTAQDKLFEVGGVPQNSLAVFVKIPQCIVLIFPRSCGTVLP